MNGVYGMSAITALTAQNTTGVRGIFEVSSEFLEEQLDAVFEDIFPDAVKIGMVASAGLVEATAGRLRHHGAENIVVDPVMVATSGSALMKTDAVAALGRELLPMAALVTPNIPEGEVLSGMSIQSREDMEKAAQKISGDFSCPVLLKGGHALCDADDLLCAGGKLMWFHGERINTPIHGTYNIENEVSYAPDNYDYFKGTYANNGSYDDFEQGEHYLELSVTEENMVEKVCSEFSRVVIIINANNAMKLGWVDDYPSIGAVILAPGAGNTGFAGLGKIISGEVNPSGRTVDTYVKDLTRTPTWNNFDNFAYTNVDDLRQQLVPLDPAYQGAMSFVNYVEGIYVGYKFYETAAQEGIINYDEYVQYPFGYGLSYTTFSQTIENFSASGDIVSFDVKVTNTGSAAGKDVVEVYFEPP